MSKSLGFGLFLVALIGCILMAYGCMKMKDKQAPAPAAVEGQSAK